MNAQSMTGYGRCVTGKFRVEIRSSNHKHLEIQTNLPPFLYPHETAIKKLVRQRFNRGRIDLYIPRQESEDVRIKVNINLLHEYYNALKHIREELGIKDEISMDLLAQQKDIFLTDELEVDDNELMRAVNEALEDLEKSRESEAVDLLEDITGRIDKIKRHLSNVEERRDIFMAGARQKLEDRLRSILDDVAIDEIRLIQETAIIVEKTDITEEIIRLQSHLDNFTSIVESGDTIGKKLDFVVQEIRREINTIGAKAQDPDIVRSVIEMKHEAEKVREQIQNLQ